MSPSGGWTAPRRAAATAPSRTTCTATPTTRASRGQLAFDRNLANEAHRRGLAIALKKSGDQARDLVAYFDLEHNAVSHRSQECVQLAPFTAAGKPVLNVEYPASRAAAEALAEAVSRPRMRLDSRPSYCRSTWTTRGE